MTIDRAIEILDPTHREHYESIDPVNEACRMGIEALELQKSIVRCKDCNYGRPDAINSEFCWCVRIAAAMIVRNDDFCSYGMEE